MNEIVKAYLDAKKAEEAAQRAKFLEEQGIYQKVFPQSDTYNQKDYPEWDVEKQKDYRRVPIEVTDEEFREIEKYANRTPTSKVGKRIMVLATFLCWVGVIASLCQGVLIIGEDEDKILLGLLVAIGGSLLAWISTWCLYAYGKLVDDVQVIRRKLEEK